MSEPRRYGEPAGDPNLGFESARDLEAIGDHIERQWGKVEEVFHEIVSEYVHIDLHVVRATAERPYHFLVTSGMSDRPMTVPEGSDECGYAELLVALPEGWPVDHAGFHDERNYWPFRQLKQAARFPHIHQTWFWYGHTFANGDPPEAYAPDVSFCASILSIPALCDQAAWQLEISPEKRIQFFSLIPIYEEELRFAWSNGSDALFERLDGIDITELISQNRKNVCKLA
jgi:hypothetical protein